MEGFSTEIITVPGDILARCSTLCFYSPIYIHSSAFPSQQVLDQLYPCGTAPLFAIFLVTLQRSFQLLVPVFFPLLLGFLQVVSSPIQVSVLRTYPNEARDTCLLSNEDIGIDAIGAVVASNCV